MSLALSSRTPSPRPATHHRPAGQLVWKRSRPHQGSPHQGILLGLLCRICGCHQGSHLQAKVQSPSVSSCLLVSTNWNINKSENHREKPGLRGWKFTSAYARHGVVVKVTSNSPNRMLGTGRGTHYLSKLSRPLSYTDTIQSPNQQFLTFACTDN